METIKISELDRNGLQTRVALDEQTVNDYAEAMRGRAKFPPVIVFRDGSKRKLYLADGFHRVEAAQRAGFKAVKADVKAGAFADALKYALGANANHGLRRSNADKRRTLEMAWENRRDLWPRTDNADPSASILSEVCGVSLRTVQDFLAEIQHTQNVPVEPPRKGKSAPVRKAAPTPPPVRKVFGKDGKTRDVPVPKAARPMPQTTGRCRFTDANGFCTNDAMQGGGFKCFGAGCGGREEVPLTTPVRSAAPTRKSGHAPNVMLDRFGVEIPMEIRDAFMDNTPRDQIESMLQSAYRLLKGAMEAQDPSVAQFRQADLIDLQNAVRTARFTKPYCVCRICQGNGRGSCSACHETGFQTEEQYKRNPKEFLA